MRNIARLAHHVRPLSARTDSHHLRLFSATARRTDSRPLRSIKYLDVLRKEASPTHEPLWAFLHCLSKSTHKNEMSFALARQGVSVDEYRRWKPIMYESDIALAVHLLDGWGFKVRPADSEKKEIPIWVLLYTIAFKVRTPQHALTPLMDLFHAYVDSIPSTTRGPLFVFTMLHLARFDLIQPMSTLLSTFLTTPFCNPAEEELHFNLILQSISAKPTPLQENAELVVKLLRAMEGRQLRLRPETYDTLLTDRFVTLELTKYLHTRMAQQLIVRTHEHLEADLRVFAQDGAIHDPRRYLGAVHGKNALKHASAFKFLHDLVHRRKMDTYESTTALDALSKDRTVPPMHLIDAFAKLPARPSIVTWTVLIRGLLLRKKFFLAERYAHRMINTGLPLDREAVTVAAVAFTREGKPQLGVWVLEKYAGGGSKKRMRLTVGTINELMSALNKIHRPDVVFRLWDNMHVLYNVHPNSTSLDIVLQAARIAMRMDMSVSGALAELGLFFRTSSPEVEGKKREEALKEITDLVGVDPRSARVYKNGIWKSQVASDTARLLFLRILFSSPHSAKLWATTAPAGAVRESLNSDPFLPPSKPTLYKFVPPPSFPTTPSPYPGVQLTPQNFQHYILLLGLSDRSPEIPLTLAWMRACGLALTADTLACALVFFGEVAVHAPLVEAVVGERGEVGRLKRWTSTWVGEGVVGEAEGMVERWRRIVGRMRGGG